MPTFRYKAVTRDGEPDEGQMVAASSAAVIRQLQESGRIPIFAEESAEQDKHRAKTVRRFRSATARPDVMAFTRSLAVLLSAGTPFDRALDIMLEVETDPAMTGLVRAIQSDVRGGDSFSEALRRRGDDFSGFYVNMVFAAETSGDLGPGLERLVTYLERTQQLHEKVRSALVYPTILLLVAGISVIVLLTFVVPQFRPMFEDMGAALPLATRAVLVASDFMARFGWLLLLACAGGCFALQRFLTSGAFRRRIDRLALRTPIVNDLLVAAETARFSRTLGTLLSSGVALLEALEIASGTLANRILRGTVQQSSASLKEGGSLSQTLAQSQYFPALAIQMIKVGEETGAIETMIQRVADIYEQELDNAVRRALALLEPVLIIGLGVLIAGIILSVLVGIISVNDLPM